MEQPVQTEMWKARSLEELVRILHRLFAEDKVSVEEVQALMESYESNPEEWLQYAKFDQYRYGAAPPPGHGQGAAQGGGPRDPRGGGAQRKAAPSAAGAGAAPGGAWRCFPGGSGALPLRPQPRCESEVAGRILRDGRASPGPAILRASSCCCDSPGCLSPVGSDGEIVAGSGKRSREGGGKMCGNIGRVHGSLGVGWLC